MKRGSSGLGGSGHTVSARLRIRPGLLELEYRKNPEPLKRTDIPPSAGASRRGNWQAARAKHEDKVVLEVRRLYEQVGMMPKRIAETISLQHGVIITKTDVDRYVAYQTRAALVPDPDAAPYL